MDYTSMSTRLDEIVKLIQSGCPLEDILKLYKEGKELHTKMELLLTQAEEEVREVKT